MTNTKYKKPILIILLLSIIIFFRCDLLNTKENESNQNTLSALVALASQSNATQIPDTDHTVGGTLSGQLNGGSIVLQLNSANNLSKNAIGNFVFGTTLKSKTTYTVSIFSKPNGVTCGITSGGTGTIGSSDVTNVVADCNICANGTKASYEACDDGNLVNGDGCSNTCTVEPSFTCSNTSPSSCNVCGNGTKVSYEACDDGNISNGDGCSSTCTVEPGYTCINSPSVCTN